MQTLQEKSEVREQRARQILELGTPQALDAFTYLVPSQFDSSKRYKIVHVDSYSCECEDFNRRCKGTGLYCKHIKAILLFEKVKTACDVEDIKGEIGQIAEQPLESCCPHCKSKNLIRRGVRATQTGKKQRFGCKDCHKRFVLSPIPKIKGDAKLVCLAMDCFYKGLSYRDISDQFKQFYGLSISHVTIRDWVLKFGGVMEKYAKTLNPSTSGVWNADETLVLTKKGTLDYEYVWNVIDKETRFLLASVNSRHNRGIEEAKAVMTEAYQQNKEMPTQIITDRLPSYQEGIRKAFKNWGENRKVMHTSILGRRRVVNNNAIENLHAHQKEFQKVRRGINEVQDYADGFKVFHNFVRKGVADKLTPADRSGIGIQGQNRWETLLLKAIKEVPNLTGETKMAKSP